MVLLSKLPVGKVEATASDPVQSRPDRVRPFGITNVIPMSVCRFVGLIDGWDVYLIKKKKFAPTSGPVQSGGLHLSRSDQEKSSSGSNVS